MEKGCVQASATRSLAANLDRDNAQDESRCQQSHSHRRPELYVPAAPSRVSSDRSFAHGLATAPNQTDSCSNLTLSMSATPRASSTIGRIPTASHRCSNWPRFRVCCIPWRNCALRDVRVASPHTKHTTSTANGTLHGVRAPALQTAALHNWKTSRQQPPRCITCSASGSRRPRAFMWFLPCISCARPASASGSRSRRNTRPERLRHHPPPG